MLKLIIVDDEKVIREAISTIIDWKKYDIELIKLCKNGLEAYNTIMDESPDIVLTDIRMPCMDGLQLIKNISEMELNIQFIILSGYGEFEYAKTAMQYGVKHYLLKPCNERQIVDCIQKTAYDCYQKKLSMKMGNSQFFITNNMHHSVISSIINDTISQNGLNPEVIMSAYEAYMDFYYTPYTLLYIYFLEIGSLNEFLQNVKNYFIKKSPHSTIHGIYVNNTMLLFFKDYSNDYQELIQYLIRTPLQKQHIELEIEIKSYPALKDLLLIVLEKIKRFSMIYYINNFHIFASCNYNIFIEESERFYQRFIERRNPEEIEHLIGLFDGIGNLNFCRQMAISLFLKISTDGIFLSGTDLTELLTQLNQESSLEQLKIMISDKLRQLLIGNDAKNKLSSITKQIINFVEANIQNQNLTLKYIAEHELYMNVDYVSRKFFKETGKKFSNYLYEIRIKKAQEYLACNETDKIQDIAELVGYGNNPQYFSQQFKKMVGMTPSAYYRNLLQK